MRRNHGLQAISRVWPLRVFKVAENSMQPALEPGDALVTMRGGEPRQGQVRVFRDPRLSSRWLVKRVGEVYRTNHGVRFEARSDNPGARGAVDSHEFGWIDAAETYRVVLRLRGGTER
jgi:signal peptidase I